MNSNELNKPKSSFGFIFLVSIVSTFSSVAIYHAMHLIFHFDARPAGYIVSIVIPLIISPLTTCYHVRQSRKNYLLQLALEETNARLQAKNKELEQALQEVKTLKGFIPICSVCRKIRSDDGYWEVLEEYIHQHTDAQLSHGVCPDCLKREYPEFHDSVVKKIKK